MITTTYNVTGMTCQHCVNSVTQELSTLDGVTAVEVNLEKGEVTVTSSSELDTLAAEQAIEEAGYTLA
jgi:copper chaperone